MPVLVNGLLAVVFAYLLGSIPTAFITTRLKTGQDIRQLGSGNAGARNVFREVGLGMAVITAVVDVGKGAVAVFLAQWLLDFPSTNLVGFPQALIMMAGLAAVAGHIWPVYLKFVGGNGLSPTIGVLAVLMPRELLIALALTLLLIIVTRNPVLSVNISLLFAVPVSTWFLEESGLLLTFVLILALVLVLHFLPTARAAVETAGSKKNVADELLRRGKPR